MLNCWKYLLFILLFFPGKGINAQNQQMREENRHCLQCHSNQMYTFFNDWTSLEERRLMNPFHVIDTTMFLNGVHKTFACIDCHSMDYETYPHMGELKLEPMATCIDCHGGDPQYEKYQFEKIEEEFHKSVHFEKVGDLFSCNKCHNQHYYHTATRNSVSVEDIVKSDNQMCMSCHSDALRYQMTATQKIPALNEVHSWLPNNEIHFRSVRCIDCHTAYDEDLMVSHNILPKEQAVRKCSECHSSSTMLQATLYRYENIQARQKQGFLAAFQQDQPYIIGANQVPEIKYLSMIIMILALVVISIHITFRIKYKK